MLNEWQQFLAFTVSGLSTAAIYAIAASGLVLTYTTTGTFNFAHGATSMVAGFTYWQLRFGWHWPAPVAIAVCLLVLAPLWGVVVERVIMRRLEDTSETTRLVVTVALLLGLLGLALFIWDPLTNRPMRTFWQGDTVTVFDVRLPWHRLASLAVAVLVALFLRILLYRMRTGVAMRATVDNRDLAELNGVRSERTAMLAWIVGSGLAAISGILVAPTVALSAVPLTLIIVNAYAAAVFGRLRSLPMTFLGAVLLGLAHDYGIGYKARLPDDWQPYLQGFVDAIPGIFLFVVLLVLPTARLRRVTRTREFAYKPQWSGSIAFAITIVVGSAMIMPFLSDSDLVVLGRIWGLAIIGLSMVPLIGLAGQLSLCQLSFVGVGALAVAHLNTTNPLGLLWAAAIAALVGVLVALPAIRLSGIYLALATAAFAVISDRWIFQFPRLSVFGHEFRIFQGGSLTVRRFAIFGWSFDSSEAYFVFAAVVYGAVVLGVVAIRRSRYGERLIAIKEGPAAAATLGINVTGMKLSVFALSAAIAGVGGAIYAAAARTASTTDFDLFRGLPVLMSMVIGGVSTVGASLFTGLFLGAPALINLIPGFARVQTILVGFAGVGLGRNPNGFVSEVRPIGAAVRRDRIMLVAMLAALLGVWLLRASEVIQNPAYAISSVAVLLGAAGVTLLRVHGRGEPLPLTPLFTRPVTARTTDLSVPPEALGLTVAYVPGDAGTLDDLLGLAHAGAGAGGGRA